MGCSRTRKERLDNLANKTTTNLRSGVTFRQIENTELQKLPYRHYAPNQALTAENTRFDT